MGDRQNESAGFGPWAWTRTGRIIHVAICLLFTKVKKIISIVVDPGTPCPAASADARLTEVVGGRERKSLEATAIVCEVPGL